MNETTDDQIRGALENAERKALEAGEIFTDRQAHELVAGRMRSPACGLLLRSWLKTR